MNRSYSKIRHIQESNMLLERRILNEKLDPAASTAIQQMATNSQNLVTGLKGLQFDKKTKIENAVLKFNENAGYLFLDLTFEGYPNDRYNIQLYPDTTNPKDITKVQVGSVANAEGVISNQTVGRTFNKFKPFPTYIPGTALPETITAIVNTLTNVANMYGTTGVSV